VLQVSSTVSQHTINCYLHREPLLLLTSASIWNVHPTPRSTQGGKLDNLLAHSTVRLRHVQCTLYQLQKHQNGI
jgi:hypothetical protein